MILGVADIIVDDLLVGDFAEVLDADRAVGTGVCGGVVGPRLSVQTPALTCFVTPEALEMVVDCESTDEDDLAAGGA